MKPVNMTSAELLRHLDTEHPELYAPVLKAIADAEAAAQEKGELAQRQEGLEFLMGTQAKIDGFAEDLRMFKVEFDEVQKSVSDQIELDKFIIGGGE